MTIETETNPEPAEALGVEAVDAQSDVHPDNRPAPEPEPEPQDENGDPPSDAEGEAEEEEEVDYGGKKYRIPKAMAAERLMQADYTRKTTAHAEAVRAWEAQRAAADADDEATRADYGKVHALKANLAEYEAIDWQALNVSDPGLAQTLWMQREQAKEALTVTEGELQRKSQERLSSQQSTIAKAMQETGTVLSRDIKGWSPALANDIASFGIKEFGITPKEVTEMADPRLWKVLHRAMVAEQALTKQKAGAVQEKLQAVTPAKTVTERRAAPAIAGLDDRLSQAEWLRRRNEQVGKRR